MVYVALMVIIVFVSMFVNGIQMFRNGKLVNRIEKLKKIKSTLTQKEKEVY